MMNQRMNMWWAYLHTNGSVQVKRFFDQRDITETKESSFVTKIVGPFAATNRDNALEKAANSLGVEQKGS